MPHALKRRVALFAAVLLLLFAVPVAAEAENGVFNYDYNVENGKAVITGYRGHSNAVVIPSLLFGYEVYSVSDKVFSGHDEIETLVFGENISSIGDEAFKGCSGIKTLDLPLSLRKIGARAFADCREIFGVRFGKVEEICENAFEGCVSLRGVILPDTLKTAGSGCFRGCFALGDAVILSDEAKLSGDMFEGCTEMRVYGCENVLGAFANCNLESHRLESPNFLEYETKGNEIRITGLKTDASAIVIPERIDNKKVTSIAAGALRDRNSLKAVVLPDSLRVIEEEAFAGDRNLSFLSFPDKFSGLICEKAFKDCLTLRRVFLPEGLATLSAGVFDGCANLEIAEFPKSLTAIRGGAFRGCEKLSRLIFRGAKPDCAGRDGSVDKTVMGDVPKSAEIFADSGYGWDSLPSGVWHPNGKKYEGFRVAVSKAPEPFYVAEIKVRASCTEEGLTEFRCPFTGKSYTEKHAATAHEYISTGVSGAYESFVCKNCSKQILKGHIRSEDIISWDTDISAKGIDIVGKIRVSFLGQDLTEGKDFTVEKIPVDSANRIEVLVTAAGDYTGGGKFAVSSVTANLIKPKTLTVTGADGGGEYYPGDRVEIHASPETGKRTVWTADNGYFAEKDDRHAIFVMPDNDAAVSLSYEPIPDTEPPETTSETPAAPATTSETPPGSDPAEITTAAPFEGTDDARAFHVKMAALGAALVLSLCMFAWLCAMMFKKKK